MVEWHVWWTCGPQVRTAPIRPVQFDVKNQRRERDDHLAACRAGGFLATGHAHHLRDVQIEVTQTTTTSAFDGVTFHQPLPGAVITLSATVGGVYDGQFLFFVEGARSMTARRGS